MKYRVARQKPSEQPQSEAGRTIALLREDDHALRQVATSDFSLSTHHGRIAVSQTIGRRLPILLLHGGGLCKEIFVRQLQSGLGNHHRMIAIDLPGHGQSDDAANPDRTYSIAGLADLALEVLERLDIDAAVVVGVSLGGRVALEMIHTFPGLIGVGLTGVPVTSSRTPFRADLAEFGLVGDPTTTHDSEEIFLHRAFGDADLEGFRAAVTRADRNCLERVMSELRAEPERWPTSADLAKTPVLAIAGSSGPVTNTGRESGGQRAQSRFSISQSGPAPYLQVPEIYNHILARFMARMAKRERQLSASPETWYGG